MIPSPASMDATAPPAALPHDLHKVLSFELGSETYGIDIRQIQEVRSFEAPTPLPHSPPWLLGVTDLRGTVVPIVDLRVRLGLPATFETRTVTAVLDLGTQTTGIVVDGVSDVLELRPADLRALPPDASSEQAGVIALACMPEPHGARPLILLDPAVLLGPATSAAPAQTQA